MKYTLSLIALLLLLPQFGCVSRVSPGADPLVVRAEELAERATDSMIAFSSWESKNRAAVSRDVTAAADLVREFGQQYLEQLRTATKTYKGAKNQPNEDALKAAMETLQGLLDDAREYYLKGGK